jgi:hypothetical protein
MVTNTSRKAPNKRNKPESIFVDEDRNRSSLEKLKQAPFFVHAWLLVTQDQD